METHSPLFHQQAEALLRAVASGSDQWQSRRQIAQQLGKRYLNPVEVFVLDVLTEQGQVERRERQRSGTGPVRYIVYYRLKAQHS